MGDTSQVSRIPMNRMDRVISEFVLLLGPFRFSGPAFGSCLRPTHREVEFGPF